MKNSQFFTQKSAKSFGRVNSSRTHRAEYVPARKGGRYLRDQQGMIYFLRKRRENKTYYFCTEKKNLTCPATAVVEDSTEMIIKISGDHAHDNNILQSKVRHLEEQAIRNAALALSHDTNLTSNRNMARDQRREELKSLVGNFSIVTLNVFMSSPIDFFNR